MKNILLLVHDDAGQEARFQVALDLTRALEGHLTCLDVAEMPQIVGGIETASIQAELIAEAEARESKNRQALEARLEREDVPWNWIDVTGPLAVALKRAAGMADLIVVSRKLDSAAAPDMRRVASQVVIGSGRAVVAVPEGAEGFEAAGIALVAWDGSDEAMKAMQMAVPLLQLARTVIMLEVSDRSIESPAEEAAAYLSRHGIHAVVMRRRPSMLTVAEAILAEARANNADYVVMGGFGHSRIVEALVGGVSRDMLTESPLPTLLAH